MIKGIKNHPIATLFVAFILFTIIIVGVRSNAKDKPLTSAQEAQINTIVNNYNIWGKEFYSSTQMPNRIMITEYNGDPYFLVAYKADLDNSRMGTGGYVTGYAAFMYTAYSIEPTFREYDGYDFGTTLAASGGTKFSTPKTRDDIVQAVEAANRAYLNR